MDYGFFAQDNWKIRPRLTLQLGLRYDYETIPPAVPNLTTATGTFVPYTGLTNNPSDGNNFGPRIGFSYDLLGRGTTVLRGGYGIYFGRINNGNLLNVRLNTGSPNGQYTTTYKNVVSGSTPAGPQLPNIVTTPAPLLLRQVRSSLPRTCRTRRCRNTTCCCSRLSARALSSPSATWARLGVNFPTSSIST